MSAQQKKARTPPDMRWRLYESMKAAWLNANKNATPEQYQRAIYHIAKRCGV